MARMRYDDMSLAELADFCEWVAQEVCTDEFEENAGCFAELCCRKLYALGFVRKTDEEWKTGEDE